MKSQTLILLIALAIQLIASGCSDGTLAYIPPIRGVAFTSSDEAWALTKKRVLKRISIDGQSVKVEDTRQRIHGMSFISPTQGWTVDSDWNVWRFNGVNWEFVGHNDDNKFGLIWPSSVIFVDENVAWARTLEPLFITDDVGKTWKKVLVTEPGELLNLFVVDGDFAYLYGPRGSIRRTTDRGQTWKSLDLGPVGDMTAFACRAGGRKCWAGSGGGEMFAIEDEEAPRRLAFPTPKEMTITHISLSGDNGLLVTGFTLVRDDNPRAYGVLLKSNDEGATWTTVQVPQDDRLVQVASFGDTIWLASNTAIYRSSDGGGSWVKIYDASN